MRECVGESKPRCQSNNPSHSAPRNHNSSLNGRRTHPGLEVNAKMAVFPTYNRVIGHDPGDSDQNCCSANCPTNQKVPGPFNRIKPLQQGLKLQPDKNENQDIEHKYDYFPNSVGRDP